MMFAFFFFIFFFLLLFLPLCHPLMVAILDLSVFYLVESPGGSYRDSTEWGFSCDIFSVCKHLMWRNLYLSKLFSKKKKKKKKNQRHSYHHHHNVQETKV